MFLEKKERNEKKKYVEQETIFRYFWKCIFLYPITQKVMAQFSTSSLIALIMLTQNSFQWNDDCTVLYSFGHSFSRPLKHFYSKWILALSYENGNN